MNTNIKILIGAVVVVILFIMGILVFKYRENFNEEGFSTLSEYFYKNLHYLYHAINQTIIPDFYNADRTTDITQSQDIEWPSVIQNHTTINKLNSVYSQFKLKYSKEIDELVSLSKTTDIKAYTMAYNKVSNTLINMSIPDPNAINIVRLNSYIVLTANPDIPSKLLSQYAENFTKLSNFVRDMTPL